MPCSPSRLGRLLFIAAAALAPCVGCTVEPAAFATGERDAAAADGGGGAETADAADAAEDAAEEHVATSAHVLVLTSTNQAGTTEIAVLDLDTGQSHDLVSPPRSEAPVRPRLQGPRAVTATRQGTTLVTLSGPPHFAQLDDSGFQPLQGTAAESDDSSFAGFVAEGRYVLYLTWKPPGFVLYDTQSREPVWRIDHDERMDAEGEQLRIDAAVGPNGAFAVQLGARTLAGHAGDEVVVHELAEGADLPAFAPDGARIAYAVHDPERSHSKLEWMTLADGERHALSIDLPFAAPRFFLPDQGGVVALVHRQSAPDSWDLRNFALEGERKGTPLHDPAGPGITTLVGALDRSSLLVEFARQDGLVQLAALDSRATNAPTPIGAYGAVSAQWPLGRAGFSFFSDPGTLDGLFSVHAIVPGAQGSSPQVFVLDTDLRTPGACRLNPAQAASGASFLLGTLYEDVVPDDLYVYGNDPRSLLFVIDVADGTPKRIATLGDGTTTLSCPVWSPNQRGFAYASSTPAGSRIYLVRRTSSGLSEPELVYESGDGVQIIAARL